MPDDPNIFSLGSVRLTFPKTVAPDLHFSFEYKDEKVRVSAYSETPDGDPKTIAKARLENALSGYGDSIQVVRQEETKIENRPAIITVLNCKESDGRIFTLCQLIVKLAPSRFVDLTYQFDLQKHRDSKDFDAIINSVHFPANSISNYKPVPLAPGFQRWNLLRIELALPARLNRMTPWAFIDTQSKLTWTADAVRFPLPVNTIPPEPRLNGETARSTEPFAEKNIDGAITAIRTVNTETGQVGNTIYRADVVIGRTVNLTVRTSAPPAIAKDVPATLKNILLSAALVEN